MALGSRFWTGTIRQQAATVLGIPLMIAGLVVLWRMFRVLGRGDSELRLTPKGDPR